VQRNYPVINGKLASEKELFDKCIHAKDRHYIQGGNQLPHRNIVAFLPRSKKEEKQLAEFHCTWGRNNADLDRVIMFQLVFDGILILSVLMTVSSSLYLCVGLLSYNHCWYCPRDYVQLVTSTITLNTHTHKYFLQLGSFL